MSVTAQELEASIVPVRAALAAFKRKIDGVSDPTLKLTWTGAYNTFSHQVDDWATAQRDEVLQGKRDVQRWKEYGLELAKDGDDYAGSAGAFAAQFSAAADTLGTLSEEALAPLDSRVGELQKQLVELTQQRNAWATTRDALAPVRTKLPQDVQDLYWGPPAASAQASFDRFKFIVDGLSSGLRALHGGQSIDFSKYAQPLSGGLGNPFVGVAGAFAVIAIAAALAVSLRAFFAHATEASRAAVDAAIIELARTNPDAALALKDKINDGRTPDPTFSAGAVVAVVGLVGIGIGVAWWLLRKKSRTTNPRRRRAQKSLPTQKRKRKKKQNEVRA